MKYKNCFFMFLKKFETFIFPDYYSLDYLNFERYFLVCKKLFKNLLNI